MWDCACDLGPTDGRMCASQLMAVSGPLLYRLETYAMHLLDMLGFGLEIDRTWHLGRKNNRLVVVDRSRTSSLGIIDDSIEGIPFWFSCDQPEHFVRLWAKIDCGDAML